MLSKSRWSDYTLVNEFLKLHKIHLMNIQKFEKYIIKSGELFLLRIIIVNIEYNK